MTWLSKLKGVSTASVQQCKPAEPTKPTSIDSLESFAGFAGPSLPSVAKSKICPAPTPELTLNAGDGCWPYGDAMNGAEIYAFLQRVKTFSRLRLSSDAAESEAMRLMARDRSDDERTICLECLHLYGAKPWRCSNALQAGLAERNMDVSVSQSIVFQLQRCPGFEGTCFGQ